MASRKVVFIVGRTASGKSAAAMDVARRLDGEIICADSQTLRKGLDIGTAKPSKEEQAEIPHHMIDIIEPYQRYSVAEFKLDARQAIDSVIQRGRVPIVVGGSGLYIDALYYDYSIDCRESFEDNYEELSVSELQELIEKRGYELPENAQNPRHLVGVLRRKGVFHTDKKPIPGAVIIGLDRPDDELHHRIKVRIDEMFESGFLNEVEAVLEKYGRPPHRLDAIGYPIATKVIDGEITTAEAKKLFAQGDWQYARKQKAWFKRNEHIAWFNTPAEATEYILHACQ